MQSFVSGVLLFLSFVPTNSAAQLPTAAQPPSAKQESVGAASAAKSLPPAAPLLSSALCETGVFVFTMNGQPVGRELFKVTCQPEGGYRTEAHTELKVPGLTADLQWTLEIDKAAVPTKFTAKGTGAGVAIDQTLVMKNGKATFTSNGTSHEVSYTPGAAFSTPGVGSIIQFLAARYDATKGGSQEIDLFPNFKMRIERVARDEVQATGPLAQITPEAFDRYNMQMGVVSMTAWADSKGRIVVAFTPMQNFVVAREQYLGFVNSLRTATAAPANGGELDYSVPANASFTAEEVLMKNKDITLAGTLLLPKSGRPPFPAVVTITGSGQQTRDEPIPIAGLEKYRPFRQIAESLAGRGIAVLRVDDRGVGKSTGRETLSKVTTFDFADDTRAEVAYLRTRKEIDPKRIALVGHSEGGIIAPLVAASDPNVAAIVLMAGTAKRGDAVIMDQLSDLLEMDPTMTKEEKTKRLIEQQLMLKTIIEGGDISKFPDTIKNAWYKNFLIYDPLPTIRKVHQPILILQGELDRQVTADQATALQKAALEAGHKDVTVHIFPKLNHLFLFAKTGSFTEYPFLSTSTIGDDVLNILGVWLQEELRDAKKP